MKSVAPPSGWCYWIRSLWATATRSGVMVGQIRARFFASSQIKIRMGPSGIQLFDRTTGLNILLDEVPVPPTLWAEAPRQVSVALTNACDLLRENGSAKIH